MKVYVHVFLISQACLFGHSCHSGYSWPGGVWDVHSVQFWPFLVILAQLVEQSLLDLAILAILVH